MRILPGNEEGISEAADILKAGGLVGMPTETVYGIAANALDAQAVQKTFDIKGRPADNPLIVHVADLEQAKGLAREVPSLAPKLARAFWPGPLTLVLPKSPLVPRAVTAGLDTVAVRAPSHPVARALILKAGIPLSAPSANVFMGLSPTSAQDISPEIASKLDAILDGGPCQVGIESTVLDLTVDPPALLRPGAISREQIEEVLGRTLAEPSSGERRSPGSYTRHYSPRTPVRLVEKLDPDACGLTFAKPASAFQIEMPKSADTYARELYKSLCLLDSMGCPEIQVERPPDKPEWEAVWDRLRKASGGC